MQVVCIGLGALLLWVGVKAIPGLVTTFGVVDDAYWVGQAFVITVELTIGALLLRRGIRSGARKG